MPIPSMYSAQIMEYLKNRVVVVVDPSTSMRAMISMALGALDFPHVKAVSNTADARKILNTSDVGLFIVEWILTGENGLHFCRRLKASERARHIPFLLLSYENSRSDVMLASEVGVDSYLLKPFSQDAFQRKVSELLEGVVNPSELENLLSQGELAICKSDFVRAREFFKQAYLLNESSARALTGLARAQISLGKGKIAIKILKQAMKVNPEFLQANRVLMRLFEQQGFSDGILKQARLLHVSSPNNPSYTLMLASVLLHRNELDEAEECFERTLSLSPKMAECYTGLGDIAFKKNDAGKAAINYQKALDIDSMDVSALNSLGMAFVHLGRVQEGVRNYKLALRLSPNDSRIYFNLGQAYERMDRVEKAAQFYQRAIEKDAQFDKAINALQRAKKKAQGQKKKPLAA